MKFYITVVIIIYFISSIQPTKKMKRKIRVFQAQLRRSTRTIGQMSPFAIIQLNGCTKQTKVHEKAGKKPKWNQIFEFPHQQKDNKIKIKVFDNGTFGGDEIIGEGDKNLDLVQKNEKQVIVDVMFDGKIVGKVWIFLIPLAESYQPDSTFQSVMSPTLSSGAKTVLESTTGPFFTKTQEQTESSMPRSMSKNIQNNSMGPNPSESSPQQFPPQYMAPNQGNPNFYQQPNYQYAPQPQYYSQPPMPMYQQFQGPPPPGNYMGGKMIMQPMPQPQSATQQVYRVSIPKKNNQKNETNNLFKNLTNMFGM